ncbi:MAG: UDP-N-acetylglucosamine--N-acetylmuramyl-(pentapeptide) pyrophosphoryl-undecaprenol N-acetylglucosamine transferase [Planctomycetota bacterium]
MAHILASDAASAAVMADRPVRVALAGGGTGGHLVPGLHLLRHAMEFGPRLEHVLWFTSGRPVEREVLRGLAEELPGVAVEVLPLPLESPGGGAPGTWQLLRRSPRATHLARRALVQAGSEVLLGLGGFTALPAVLAARSLRVPVGLYEVNAVAGKATRRLGSLAQVVLHAGAHSVGAREGDKARVIGPIVGPKFQPAGNAVARGAAKRAVGFAPDRPLLLVLGGSQGAGAVNQFVAHHAEMWTEAGWQVLHQVGPSRLAEGAGVLPHYRAVEYWQDMAGALQAADLVLGRGGASTLAEIGAVHVPTWVAPFPHHADRHQWHNAAYYGGGMRIVEDAQLDGVHALELARLATPEGRAQLEARRAAFPDLGAPGAERAWQELVALLPVRRS